MEQLGKVFGIIGDDTYSQINLGKKAYILEDINKFTDIKKIEKALSMVRLDSSYINIKSNDLSDVEYNKLLLALDLINGEKDIILIYFEKGLCYKERQYFKKIIRKFSKSYGVNFYIKTNDFMFLYDLVDEYVLFKDKKVMNYFHKDEVFTREVWKYFDKHPNIDFLIKSRKFNHLLGDYYIETSDILKAVYREIQ